MISAHKSGVYRHVKEPPFTKQCNAKEVFLGFPRRVSQLIPIQLNKMVKNKSINFIHIDDICHRRERRHPYLDDVSFFTMGLHTIPKVEEVILPVSIIYKSCVFL